MTRAKTPSPLDKFKKKEGKNPNMARPQDLPKRKRTGKEVSKGHSVGRTKKGT